MSEDPTGDLRATALAYAKLGWAVIPVHAVKTYADGRTGCTCVKGPSCPTPGKHPLHKDWPSRGLTSAADIYETWPDDPAAHQWNLGIVTGAASGVFVLDLDPDKGGGASFASLVAEYGPLPLTRVHTTGSGGRHYYFLVPPGTVIPTTAGALGAGLDTRGDGNGMVVAPPSVSGAGPYAVLLEAPVAQAPAWLLARLAEVQARRSAGREVPVVEAESLDIAGLPMKLRNRLADLDVTDRSAHFHGTVALCRRSGLTQGQTVMALDVWCEVIDKYAGRVAAEVARSWAKLSDADPANSVEAWLGEDGSGGARPAGAHESGSAPPLPPDVAELIRVAREYQDLPDPTHIVVTAAVAVTRDVGDPVWVLIVGAPSSGKTETSKGLRNVAEAHLDDVTVAGLLSWRGGKNPKPVGLLTRIGEKALVTFGDLSTLLASSDKGGRDLTFAALRRVYDGDFVRDLGTAPEPLEWHGKLTVVGCVTGAIDLYSTFADALGARWLYVRVPDRDKVAKRRASKMSVSGGVAAKREAFAAQMAQTVYRARARAADIEITDEQKSEFHEMATLTALGRAAVPRNGYGRREIEGPPVIEEPARVVVQLTGLATGLYALGMSEEFVRAICWRVALDSMPVLRARTLRALAQAQGPLSTAALARRAQNTDRQVIRRQLEDLEAIGISESHKAGGEPEDDHMPDRRATTWTLADTWAEEVLAAFKIGGTDDLPW